MTTEDKHSDLDEQTRARLAKLASRPVDTTGVMAKLRKQIDAERGNQDDSTARTFKFPSWARWAGRSAIAATLIIAATLLFITTQSGSVVYAAPDRMVQLHRDLVDGRAPVIPVTNLAEARKTIESKWHEAPTLPDQWDKNVHACCLRDVQSRQVACILMKEADTPVTVVVARTKDFQSPDGPTVERNGQTYVVKSHDGVNMIMAQVKDRWICVMSELPVEPLFQLAEGVVADDKTSNTK